MLHRMSLQWTAGLPGSGEPRASGVSRITRDGASRCRHAAATSAVRGWPRPQPAPTIGSGNWQPSAGTEQAGGRFNLCREKAMSCGGILLKAIHLCTCVPRSCVAASGLTAPPDSEAASIVAALALPLSCAPNLALTRTYGDCNSVVRKDAQHMATDSSIGSTRCYNCSVCSNEQRTKRDTRNPQKERPNNGQK